MKIAILGTRGIPNHYGGFEQFAEYFSVYLANMGHEVYVYNSHNHPYQDKVFKGVNIVHAYDPEYKVGTAGQFLYDYNCIKDCRTRNFDIVLQLGYTSNSVWFFMLPKKAVIITNMDGLEWKRSKYPWPMRQFLKFAEMLAVKSSDYLIADSVGIQASLKERYNKDSEYIAYGAHWFDAPDPAILDKYNLTAEHYNMVMARFEPENNIEMVLQGVVQSRDVAPILVIGNYKTRYGQYLKSKFDKSEKIRFLGPIYNIEDLNNLRYYSRLYFHGHTVGGTNPSLLEAMASGALIAAHNNNFNKGVLKENAYYFTTAAEVAGLVDNVKKSDNLQLLENNAEAIREEFNWDRINGKYLQFFEKCLAEKNRAGTK